MFLLMATGTNIRLVARSIMLTTARWRESEVAMLRKASLLVFRWQHLFVSLIGLLVLCRPLKRMFPIICFVLILRYGTIWMVNDTTVFPLSLAAAWTLRAVLVCHSSVVVLCHTGWEGCVSRGLRPVVRSSESVVRL